ncbi:Uroporphyrinogen decarboxylase [Limihaloglobus sulfuriphilus]|uniref:Uroporphyrinogen decarboxylase n=1 Tax=Limihaloglobus sulfuriphilus TaxID=1851148 RepID=A0A1Q2MCD7_9BACT|nr:uroporphyrinogen decarboxylase family protein [Limihaloglobus sulfuriphilus]AQQ70324.1 Uroporphyrinogen decarboxylase [Limihaloglobus sulfuriphilus]
MTGYERYIRMIKKQPVDIVPRTPILMQYAAEFIGSDYAAFASDYKVLVEANIRCAETFGIDQVSSISDPYRETHGFGSEITYVKNGTPRSTHPLASQKDLSLLKKPDPYKSERMFDRIKAISRYKELTKDNYSILGWVEGPAAEAADLRDTSNFLFDLIDDPAFTVELMEHCLKTGIEFALAQIDSGADTIGIGDAIASQVSPQIYEELIQPCEKKLVKAIKNAGAFVKLHICGDINHLLPGISDLGVDILDVDHMNDLRKVRTAMGSGVVLTGNIDPAAGVLYGTPDAIYQKVLQCYKEAGNPYFVNAGCEIPSGTPEQNLKALCNPVSLSLSSDHKTV